MKDDYIFINTCFLIESYNLPLLTLQCLYLFALFPCVNIHTCICVHSCSDIRTDNLTHHFHTSSWAFTTNGALQHL